MSEDLVFNKPIRLNSDDYKFGGSFEIFAGRVSLAVFESKAGQGPIIKALFTEITLTNLKVIMQKILSDPEAQPIKLGLLQRNAEINQSEWKASIIVGRDAEKVIYFDLCGDQHKEPVRLYYLDNGYTVNDITPAKRDKTEIGVMTIIDAIPRMLNAALAQAKRKDGSYPPPMSSNTASRQTSTTPVTSAGIETGSDVPFN